MNNRLKSILVLLIIILIGIYYYNNKRNLTDFIIEDYSFTRGRIVRAYTSDGAQILMDYTYFVKNSKYKNSFTPNSYKYRGCYEDFELCDTTEFWVIYSNKEPKKSMIDLSSPIEEGEDPKATRNLSNFEL
jgi:hypothetical protein